jgi:uncharacterized membrane protein YecN with MAPEG domain
LIRIKPPIALVPGAEGGKSDAWRGRVGRKRMTPSVAAVGIYAGFMGLIAIWLTMIVGSWRGRLKVAIGDGGQIDLIRAMRGHANFTENVPLALILMVYMALAGAPAMAIHVMGIALTVARILHALHFSKPDQPRWQRAIGSGLTALVIVAGSLGAIGHSIAALL